MGLFVKAPKENNSTNAGAKKSGGQTTDIDPFFINTIDSLLLFLKDFALDIEEIQSEQYKQEMDALSGSLGPEKTPQDLEPGFKSKKIRIADFIDRQKRYILEKEKELKDIIELMSQAMVSLNAENKEIYERVHDHGEKIEELTLLDDIKKIKQVLKEEVEQMRSFMAEKQNSENEHITRLSNQVSILKKELKNAKNKSLKDALTGLYNRQAFNDYARRDIENSLRTNEAMCLLLLDIDDFKNINDTFGHLIGDRVLMAFSNKCKESIRSDDFLARFGGEEFAIILKGASLRNSSKKAKLICKSIASTRYAVDDEVNGKTLKITVSIGISMLKKGDSLDSLIGRADKALYKAKRTGKNKAVNEKKI